MIVALLILVVLTGMGVTVVMMAEMDSAVSGNYRMQRTGEAATEGALEMAMAMIFNSHSLLSLPVGIDPGWSGSGDIVYRDGDLDVTASAGYKQEDNINFNDNETFVDEIVRYGRDYNYGSAHRATGRQPVYTVTLTDNVTGTRAQADVIAAPRYTSPSALFVRGAVNIRKNQWATEETIEITSDGSKPALATAADASLVFIQSVQLPTDKAQVGPVELWTYTDQSGGTYPYRINWCPDADPASPTYINPDCNDDPYPYNCWWAAWVPYCGQFGNQTPNPYGDDMLPDNYNYLHPDVYDAQSASGETVAKAREMQFILLGKGNRDELSATLNADPSLFDFDYTSAGQTVIAYDYPIPGDGTIEAMIGADFADFRNIADTVLVGNENVQLSDGAGGTIAWDHGKNLTGMSFGNAGNPQIVFFESNMNDDGTYVAGTNELVLVTDAGTRVQGFGILIINGDAVIQGSIDWQGLMLVRGNLSFHPWAGGTIAERSDATLSTMWRGWIMVGGNLTLETYYGGSIFLGYDEGEAEVIEQIIEGAIPNRVLSWKRLYPIPD